MMSGKNRAMGLLAGAAGCVMVGAASGQVINEQGKLTAFDGANLDQFGYSIDLDNGLVVVGALKDDDNGTDSGSAYLFTGATGAQVAKLLPDDGANFDEFGHAVAIDNGIVAISARNDADNGTLSGSVYLFDASTGNQLMKILPDDGAAFDEFGISVAMDSGILAVGASKDDDNGDSSGSVYLFDVKTGTQLAKLLPGDGAAGQFFGHGLDIKDGIVAVGAFFGTGIGELTGAAYVFDAATGIELAKLIADDGEMQDQFGVSVAVGNGIIAVGSPDDRLLGTPKGSVYLFETATGNQIDKLVANDADPSDSFGWKVSTDGEVLVIGAWGDDDNGAGAGSAYFFNPTSGLQLTKFLASDGQGGDSLGWSVAIDNGAVAIGARFAAELGEFRGAAYTYEIDCPVDLNGDYSYNFLDISALIGLITSGDPNADFNGDGTVNFFDVSAFLDAFSAGCP